MQIIRAKTSKVLKYIEPHLTFTDPNIKIPFMEEFVQTMEVLPESLMVIAALDDDKTLKGFIIAQNPGFKYPYIVMAQIWSATGNPWTVTEEMLARIVMWAVSLGKSSIRGETQRNLQAVYQRYGFVPVSQVVQFNLNGILQSNLWKMCKESV